MQNSYIILAAYLLTALLNTITVVVSDTSFKAASFIPIFSFSLLSLFFLFLNSFTKKCYPIIAIAASFTCTGLIFSLLYHLNMETADLVWDTFQREFPLGLVIYPLLGKHFNQPVFILFYIAIQGSVFALLIHRAVLFYKPINKGK